MKIQFYLIGITLAIYSSNSFAQVNSAPEIVASCGASKGHTYFHHSDLVSKEKSGWSEDRIKDGYFFVQKIGDDYDLIYRDPVGLQSSSDSGAVVVPAHISKNSLTLVLIYPENGNTEVYNFQHLGSEDAEASWTTTKVGALIPKSGVFYAKCKTKP